MSCDSNANLIVRAACKVSGGISEMSGKKAFAVGAAAGSAGTGLAATAIAQRRRIAGLFRKRRTASSAGLRIARPDPKPIPGLAGPSKPRPEPIPGLGSGPPSKPEPVPIPGLGSSPPSKPRPVPIPGLRRGAQSPQSGQAASTKLQAASVQVRGADGQLSTQENSYLVVRSGGKKTGLAITPYQEKGGWGVTHIASGALVNGPFESPTEANELAGKLAHLQWNTANVPPGDVAAAKIIVDGHQKEAKKVKQ